MTSLKMILMEEISNVLFESNMNRIEKWVREKEIAILSAWRSKYTNVTDDTFKPNGKNVGDEFSTKEKKTYNRELKAKLLTLGYGVTNVRGVYREGGPKGSDEQEESFFIVNLSNDADFKQKIFKLSEHYNQDSFIYSPMGTDEAVLIGTNNCDFPGYGNEVPQSSFKRNVASMFMSRIGSQGFAFADDNDTYSDDPLTFNDRKQDRLEKALNENLETFKRHSVNAKNAIVSESRKCKIIF